MSKKYKPGDPIWYGNRNNPANLNGRIGEIDAVHNDGSITILVAVAPYQGKSVPGRPMPVVSPPPERIIVSKAVINDKIWPRTNGAKVK